MTDQPSGIRPSASRVPTQGQQLASLGRGVSYLSAEMQSVYSTAPIDRAALKRGKTPPNECPGYDT